MAAFAYQPSGHLTMVSLRTRMGRIEDARSHVETARQILETAGSVARFSWVSSQCAYGAGLVALLQDRLEEAM